MLFLYNEGEALKDPNEVSSFLYEYINSGFPKNITELHLYGDNCGGKNKNHSVLRYLLFLINSEQLKKNDVISQYEDILFCPIIATLQ